jgi:hypothetical protein
MVIGYELAGISEIGEVLKAGNFEEKIFVNMPGIPEDLLRRSGFRQYLIRSG